MGMEALLVRFPGQQSAENLARVQRLALAIEHLNPPWLGELVQSYSSLGIYFDSNFIVEPEQIDTLCDLVLALEGAPIVQECRVEGLLRKIPVCYEGVFAPDLPRAAERVGMQIQEFVDAHCAPTYTVATVGFAPGFPYLFGLDARLSLPRLATPRVSVPAGSVGIGGSQTGIYPRSGPGGWQLIGRTPMALFNASWITPCIVHAGDQVQFYPISPAEFDSWT